MNKTNYRYVSILLVFLNIFEIAIGEQLIEYFINIFNDVICLAKEIWLWTCFGKSNLFLEKGIVWK